MSSLRLDRFLALYFFGPLFRAARLKKERHIPILMYHSISESNERRIHPYYEMCTSPGVFAEHMKFLYENKYKGINLDQAVKILKSSDTKFPMHRINHGTQKTQVTQLTQATQQTLVPKKPNKLNKPDKQKFVVLTFDDGFRDFYTAAVPVIHNYGFSATIFLPTAFINNNRSKFKGKECLNWQEVRGLCSKGVVFGSHTVNHPNLNMLEKDNIEFELKRSKEHIEDEIGEPIDCFSYPFAFPEEDKEFANSLRVMLKEFGYKYGVNTTIGTTTINDDCLFLKRIPINSFDDLKFFRAKLSGGYDWLFQFQLSFKLLKFYLKKKKKLSSAKG